MIDTISLRVHDLEANQQLVKFLHKRGIEGSETKRKVLDEDFDIEREMRFKEWTVDYATGNTYAKAYRTKVKSHSTDINIAFDFDRDFMQLEFSMPKYFFGDNLHQLVPHEADGYYYSTYRTTPYYDLAAAGWMMFKNALRYFWHQEFGEIPMKGQYIEVSQIDFCFNYVFKSSSQVSNYLNFIRQVRKKYAKDENQHSAYGPSSIYYPSKLCTFKIYHKGPEIKAHPGRINKKTYAAGIHALAARVLRYETGFRPAAMRELALKRSPYYKTVLAYRRWNKEGKFLWAGKEYTVGNGGAIRDKVLRDGKTVDRRWTFWLDPPEVSELKGIGVFNFALFSDMLAYFRKQSDQFILNGVSRLNVVADHVEYYDTHGVKQYADYKGLSLSRIKMLEALLRDRTFSEIERQGIMSRRQLFRYKKFFRSVGYSEASTTNRSLTDLDFTYKSYFDDLRTVKHTKPFAFKL